MRRWFRQIRIWGGALEPLVLVSILIVVGATWGFIALADRVAAGRTLAFDNRVLLALRRADNPAQPIGPLWLAEAGRDITALGGVAVLLLATAAVGGFLWLSQRRRMLVFVLVATIGGLALSQLLKVSFERERPSVVPHLAAVYTSSFPSGHSMMSAVVYLTLGTLLVPVVRQRRLKIYCLVLALLLSGLVGLSRMYLGVHYPTDVLAGWMLGLGWAVLCWAVETWLRRHGAEL